MGCVVIAIRCCLLLWLFVVVGVYCLRLVYVVVGVIGCVFRLCWCLLYWLLFVIVVRCVLLLVVVVCCCCLFVARGYVVCCIRVVG